MDRSSLLLAHSNSVSYLAKLSLLTLELESGLMTSKSLSTKTDFCVVTAVGGALRGSGCFGFSKASVSCLKVWEVLTAD